MYNTHKYVCRPVYLHSALTLPGLGVQLPALIMYALAVSYDYLRNWEETNISNPMNLMYINAKRMNLTRGTSASLPVEEQYESVNDREIRQVFEGQNRIHLEIKQLHRQLAMILDEQRRYVSVITDEVAKKGINAESGQVREHARPNTGLRGTE